MDQERINVIDHPHLVQDTAAVVQAIRESPLELQAREEGKEVHVPLPKCVSSVNRRDRVALW